MAIESCCGEQRTHDRFPLLVQREVRHLSLRGSVPVRSVAAVSFLPMKVGVNPGGLCSVLVLDGRVRVLPAPFCVEPQSSELSGEAVRRVRKMQAAFKVLDVHINPGVARPDLIGHFSATQQPVCR